MTGLRCLSLNQPWATLVAVGVKTIETRSWATKHRGRIGIASTARWPGHITIPPFSRSETREEHWNKRRWLTMPTITDPAFMGPQPQGKHIPRRAQTPTLFRGDRKWDDSLGTSSIEQGSCVYLPLGALVATANLVDCVPIVEWGTDPTEDHVTIGRDGRLRAWHFVEGSQPRAWQSLDPATRSSASGSNEDDRSDQLPYGDFAPGRWAWLLDDVKPTTERCPACWGDGGERGLAPDSGEYARADGVAWVCDVCDGKGVRDPIPVKGHQRLWTWTP